jgi:hypothetical protein
VLGATPAWRATSMMVTMPIRCGRSPWPFIGS